MTGETTDNKIAVYLNSEDVEKFKLFMEHYDLFSKLLKAQIFLIRGSSAQLHFNDQSQLRKIEINMTTKFD